MHGFFINMHAPWRTLNLLLKCPWLPHLSSLWHLASRPSQDNSQRPYRISLLISDTSCVSWIHLW